jgi:hypothetical protein
VAAGVINVNNAKVAEHRDVIEEIPGKVLAITNGMFGFKQVEAAASLNDPTSVSTEAHFGRQPSSLLRFQLSNL